MNEAGVGDLLRAWKELSISDDATRRAVRDLLYPPFDWRPRVAEKAPALPETKPPTLTPPSVVPRARSAPEEPAIPDAEVAHSVHRLPPPKSDGTLRFVLPSTDGLRLPEAQSRGPAALEPLLDRAWGRRVLGSLLATEAELGEVDEARLVNMLVQLRPVRNLPRKMRPTLRTGAQVLLDRHASMMVFYSDQSALRRQIEGIVGCDRVATFRFMGFPPTQLAELTCSSWRPYAPPPPGTPVLVVSDLGMTRGAFPMSGQQEEEWEEFLGPLRAGGNPVNALVPCEPAQYPAFVHQRLKLLMWDQRTRPSDARRIRRVRG